MPLPIRLGVIGTSVVSDVLHLPSIKSHPGAELAAICGRNQQRVVELATKYGIAGRFTDYRDMISRASLQAVVVATPDDLHHPMVMEALDANLHVLCEKPLAMSVAQARDMHQKAESRGLVTMTHFTYRWMPVYRYALKLIPDDYVGRCLQFETRYVAGYARGGNRSWTFDRRRSNGVLANLGAHMIDLARLLVGEITRVFGSLATILPRPELGLGETANDLATCELEFANGARGAIHVSAVAYTADRFQEQHLALYGEKGTLEVDVFFAGRTEIRGARADEQRFSVLPVPGGAESAQSVFETLPSLYQHQSVGPRQFIDAIIGGAPATPSFQDGYKAQAIIDAAIESDAKGCWVSVP